MAGERVCLRQMGPPAINTTRSRHHLVEDKQRGRAIVRHRASIMKENHNTTRDLQSVERNRSREEEECVASSEGVPSVGVFS